ncbi:unnamed protein product, partial [Mesorhabditis belari]|uniref:ATPase inhibitor, mitochondrial n=1 Tax=Mesorhabditis belari TaxID=2138241 RepID=A0AAF3FDP3_9BILA
MALRVTPAAFARVSTKVMQLGELGAGMGKSGGGGGSIRDAGGAFGKLEAAREGEYFHKLQIRQIDDMRKQIRKELQFSEAEITKQRQNLQRTRERLAELDKLAREASERIIE